MTWQFVQRGAPELSPSRDPSRSGRRIRDAWIDEPVQLEARAHGLELLDAHGAALADRTTSPGHLTGSALVMSAERDRVCMILHTKLRRWLQPGGHADGDHELAGVALKEASEETGIDGLQAMLPAVDLDIHRVDHGDPLGEHLHIDLRFVVFAPPGAVTSPNHESLDHRWVNLSELRELSEEESVLRLARRGFQVVQDLGKG